MGMSRRMWRSVPVLLAAAVAAACGAAATQAPEAGPRVVSPGAPGEAGRVLDAAEAAAATRQQPRHTAADVRFMQHMIVHHQQAVEMTALVEARTQNPAIRTLARRIELSQDDELALMRRWLESRNEPLVDPHLGHAGHAGHGAGAAMPGMLTAEEMARLRASQGAEFDRLFLESMIMHHEGALVMVEELFATDGAGQEVEIYQFASHVDSDQRMEIERMRRMLSQLQ
jgi:uncharacterized protein (DUF305 family)